MNVPAKFEVRSFTRSWHNWGYPKNLGSPSIRPRSLFSKILMGLCSYGPACDVNVRAKFEVRSFTRSWDNSDWNFGWGLRTCEPTILGKRRSGMVPFERALVSSYRPSSIVTLRLSLRVSEILPLLCFSTPLFPTPPLVSPKISPCSPWSRWMA